ncbi:MAG: DnaJ C-terminal domain-containing protein [Spirulina sp.]
MACNGYNHDPDCNCGWGGVYYGNGDGYPLSDRLPSSQSETGEKYVNPDAKTFPTPCPWCRSPVFYHTNGYGDSVFFDELGYPWQIHECFKNYWEEEKRRRKLEDISNYSNNICKNIRLEDVKNCSPRPERGDDLRLDLNFNHQVAWFGGEEEIRIPKLIICNDCLGHGFILTETLTQEECLSCQSNGRIPHTRKLKIMIPAGVDTGTRLRVAREGDDGKYGGASGDLYIHCSVSVPPELKRDDCNIFLTTPVKVMRKKLNSLKINEDYIIPLYTINGENILSLRRKSLDQNTKLDNKKYYQIKFNEYARIHSISPTQKKLVLKCSGNGIPHLGNPESKGDYIITLLFTD